MKQKYRFALACTVAPLFAPIIAALILIIPGVNFEYFSYEYFSKDVKESLGIIGLFLVFGVPIAYAIMLGVGLPFYIALKKAGYVNFWSVTFGSAFVSVLPILFATADKWFVVYNEKEGSSILFYLAFLFIGYSVGLIFWFVSGLNRNSTHNKSLNQIGAKDAPPG
ncbi:hypothetical protein MNBD_BACTEROID06-1046 [hydrothermal vent metagenome]|uniref:Uncharacterized protein n=1 Tax=hydrothermal vent metagenome TaxID=652676 RepID=A0A3B0UIR4_9ZZZZ